MHICENHGKNMANRLQKWIQSESNELFWLFTRPGGPDFSLRKQSWLAQHLIPDEVLQSGHFHCDFFPDVNM